MVLEQLEIQGQYQSDKNACSRLSLLKRYNSIVLSWQPYY